MRLIRESNKIDTKQREKRKRVRKRDKQVRKDKEERKRVRNKDKQVNYYLSKRSISMLVGTARDLAMRWTS